MIIQKGLKENVLLKRYVIGVHPIIQHFMDRLRMNDIMASYLPHDKRLKFPIEKTLGVVIHNILTHPTPLYEMRDWLESLDEEKLGLNQEDFLFINDDRIAKALDAFYESRHKDIFFHLTLKAIKLFDIDCRQIHQDTTSITFTGRYDVWNALPLAKQGTNKDHRPDLKQLVLGLSITSDGAFPLVHEIYDGNQSDDRLHLGNHRRLRKLLSRADFTYVADSKLATDDNLTKIASFGGKFVTVMPRTWKEDELFRNTVREDKIKWVHLLSRPNNRKPKSKRDHYYLAEGEYATLRRGYRLLWIRSSQKAQQDKDVRERNMKKALDALTKLQSGLNTYKLKTYKNIKMRVSAILKEHNCTDFIGYEITEDIRHKTKHKKAGRPKQNAPKITIREKYFLLAFERNTLNIQREALTDGVFPLVTNLKNREAKEILEIYKYQAFLEKHHSKIKTYHEIAPAFIKKAKRVIAYLHTHVMSLQVATLIERQLRMAMKRRSIKTLPIYPEEKDCKCPTIFDLVRLFRNVERYEVQHNDDILIFPAKLNKTQKQVLELLEVPMSLYQ